MSRPEFSELAAKAPRHDPSSCDRAMCSRCRGSGPAQPPPPVDHDAVRKGKPSSRREFDLGRRGEKIARRLQDEGQATSQHFAEWEREQRIPTDSTRGGGNGGAAPADKLREQKDDRDASALRRRWLNAQVRFDAVCAELGWLMDQAKPEHRSLEKHRSAAQVEADGWCGNCWTRGGVLVPVTLRPSGEPYYKGRCRGCGSWPEGDPPPEVVKARAEGRQVRVKAS